MRMGAVMMRYRSDLCLTAALSGLMVTMLLLGAILVRSAGPAAKGGRFISVSEHTEARPHTIPKSGDQVTPDIGVTDLRGTLP
jgi:hypothetical protein